jgi:UDP-N-acetylmuramyl pentapeptide synthase
MYLAFNDLVTLFPNFKGVREAEHKYNTVTDHASTVQTRGLFIPLNDNSGELLDAIANGAIAAVWDKEKPVPRYTPNHFPVFFTDNPVKGVLDLLRFYYEKLDGDNVDQMDITKFIFLDKKRLKESKETYDIAVMLEKIAKIERRG